MQIINRAIFEKVEGMEGMKKLFLQMPSTRLCFGSIMQNIT